MHSGLFGTQQAVGNRELESPYYRAVGKEMLDYYILLLLI